MAVNPDSSLFGLALPPHCLIALQCFAGLLRRQRYSAVALAGLSRAGDDSDGGLIQAPKITGSHRLKISLYARAGVLLASVISPLGWRWIPISGRGGSTRWSV